MAKLTTDEFIKRAREVHGDKYDYSKVKYVESMIKPMVDEKAEQMELDLYKE